MKNEQDIDQIQYKSLLEKDVTFDSIKNMFTILIPVLNEEESIPLVLGSVIKLGYENILVVDGHSVDNTYDIVKNKNIKIILQEGKGKTAGIKTGIKNVNTPFILVMDGDCTYDPNDIVNFYPDILKYDEVIGKRSIGRNNIPHFNRFGNFIINLIFNIVFNTRLQDVCSGMYALNTDFAKRLDFETNGFDVEVEIAFKASLEKGIAEVPIHYYDRVGEQKLRPVVDGYIIIRTILNLGYRYWFDKIYGKMKKLL